MCIFRCCCKKKEEPTVTELLIQILIQLVEIKTLIAQPDGKAVELNLQAGTPEPQHGFVNVKSREE